MITCALSSSSSSRSRSFSDFAWKSAAIQPYASRKGRETRCAPISKGRMTLAAALWTSCSGPLGASRKYTVIITSEASARAPTTSRRLSGLPVGRDEYEGATGRRIGVPSAATRTLRFRGTGLEVNELRGMTLSTVAVAAAGTSLRRTVHHFEHFEAAAGADRDARERRLGELRRHLRLVPEALVEPGEQGAAAGEDDAAVHDVRGELGRRLVERRADRVDDLADRLLERVTDFVGGEDDGLGQAREHV